MQAEQEAAVIEGELIDKEIIQGIDHDQGAEDKGNKNRP